MSQGLTQTTQYQVTCLTPVHIGTGRRFNQFDGCWWERRWWLLDLDKVLAQSGAEAALELADALRDEEFQWLRWLKAHGLSLKQVAEYSLPCWQDPSAADIREGMKNVYQQPYIPGSSIKGALRTALFDQLLIAQPAKLQQFLQPVLPTGKKEWFTQRLERRVFGDKLQEDLLRALRVQDSAPLPLERMIAAETSTFTLRANKVTKKGDNYRSFAESLLPGSQTTVSFSLDTFLLAKVEETEALLTRAQREMKFSSEQRGALWDLAKTCRARAQELLLDEHAFYVRHQAPEQTQQIDTLLAALEQSEATGGFLLNLGWGGGWERKTIGAQVRQYEDEFDRLREQFRLGKGPDTAWGDNRYLDHYFPHSRQLASLHGTSIPLGWVKLEPVAAARAEHL